MSKLTLTQNNGIINLERDKVLCELRKQGLSYQQIADMFEPPATRQAIHIAIKRYLKRMNKKASA